MQKSFSKVPLTGIEDLVALTLAVFELYEERQTKKTFGELSQAFWEVGINKTYNSGNVYT